ncbi:MAG: LytR/AlgR family response regulator transcription factor [Lachnotalea sp.]
MNIAVCDDEINSLEVTKQCLASFENIPLTAFGFLSGRELLESEEIFDVILLDIDMPDLDGIETAQQIRIRNHAIPIIFLTNYTDYTFRAFDVHAFAYLIKPVVPEKLFKALTDILSYIEEKPSLNIEFITSDGVVRLECNDIYYFEYQNRQVLLHTNKGIYYLRVKISEIFKKMKGYHFEMPHKSFVVNLFHIKIIKGYDIHMTNEDIIPLSQKKSALFRKSMNEYLSR